MRIKLLAFLAVIVAALAACTTPSTPTPAPRPSTAGPGVHVLAQGRIVRSAGRELALELERRGYGWIEAAAAAG